MKEIIILAFCLLSLPSLSAQQSKPDYLSTNRYDLETNQNFPVDSFVVFGFGAYHGSINTEIVEIKLLESLLQKNRIKYYLPEVDYSMGHYFNEYLKTGDTILLKRLVEEYGYRVPQESSIALYHKWQTLKVLNDQQEEQFKIQVIGADCIVTHRFFIKLLLDITEPNNTWPLRDSLEVLLQDKEATFYAYGDSDSKALLQRWVNKLEQSDNTHKPYIKDTFIFNHLLENLKESFGKFEREPRIFKNYKALMQHYQLASSPQFVRYGVFHLMKSTIVSYPSFFTRLIDNGVYSPNDIISAVGFLTKSEVLWDIKWADDGSYISHNTKKGKGIGDYWLEYFRGIKHLKKQQLSSMTLFQLNQTKSPYSVTGCTDLIEIKQLFNKSKRKKHLIKKQTTDFIDYAILISDSPANVPIEAMNIDK